MTTQQLYLFNGLYLVILLVVAVLTRATALRIAGALAGGADSRRRCRLAKDAWFLHGSY